MSSRERPRRAPSARKGVLALPDSSTSRVRRSARHEMPRAGSPVTLRDQALVLPALAPEWRDLIRTCLRSDPHQRPADAGELLGHLVQVASAIAELDGPQLAAKLPTLHPGLAAGLHRRRGELQS
mgnify:CR=1 FL=1